MTWLVRLYPPAWRRRYGRELEELIATQPASLRTAIDLVAAAIDAWLNPQSSTVVPTADAKGAGAMLPRMLQLRSCGYGPQVTKADNIKAAAVIVGGTLALVVVVTMAISRFGENAYLKSLMSMGWLVPFLISQRYTTYKGRPGRVKAMLIGVAAVIVMGILIGSAWLNSN